MNSSTHEHVGRLSDRQQRLVAEHGYVVERVMRHYGPLSRKWLDPDDARQQSQLGLIYAARTFRSDFRVPFAGFAWLHCVGAVLRASRRESRHSKLTGAILDCASDLRREGSVFTDTEETAHDQLKRHAMFVMAAITLTTMLTPDEYSSNPEEAVAQRQAVQAIRDAVQGLDDELRHVVEKHFFEGKDLVAVAGELSMTYPTVRRRQATALSTLKWTLKSQALGLRDDE